MEILEIKIEEISDNPKQFDIYGENYLEKEFTASIEEKGIISPVILAKASIYDIADKNYVMISGHRRKAAAEFLNLETIPAIIKNYESADDAEADFLFSNMQREKSKSQRIKESFFIKKLIDKFSQKPKKSRTWEDTIFTDNALARILADKFKEIKSDDQSVDSYKIVKEITGFTEYEQTCHNILFSDEWLQSKLEKLRKMGLPQIEENSFIEFRRLAAEAYDAEQETLNSAKTRVKNNLNQITATLSKKLEKNTKKEEKKIIKESKEEQKKEEKEGVKTPKVFEVEIKGGKIAKPSLIVDNGGDALGISLLYKGEEKFFSIEQIVEILEERLSYDV